MIVARKMQKAVQKKHFDLSFKVVPLFGGLARRGFKKTAKSPARPVEAKAGAAGKERTSVALSCERNSRLSARILSSPVRSTETVPRKRAAAETRERNPERARLRRLAPAGMAFNGAGSMSIILQRLPLYRKSTDTVMW